MEKLGNEECVFNVFFGFFWGGAYEPYMVFSNSVMLAGN